MMRGRRGSALVQVLMMSILLIILATGLMRVMFMNHTLVARGKRSDEHKFWVESCVAEKSALWAGDPCLGSSSDSCSYTAGGGPVVMVSCQGGGRIVYSVTW